MDDPCPTTGPDYCNDVDVKQWVSLSKELKTRLRTTWNEVAAEVPIPKQVAAYVTAVEKDFCDADENWVCVKYHLEPDHLTWNPLNVGENAAAIGDIIKWCGRAVCAIELLEDIGGNKGPIEPAPKPKPWFDFDFSGGMGPLMIGGGVVVALLLATMGARR